jgi:hypothetical protein
MNESSQRPSNSSRRRDFTRPASRISAAAWDLSPAPSTTTSGRRKTCYGSSCVTTPRLHCPAPSRSAHRMMTPRQSCRRSSSSTCTPSPGTAARCSSRCATLRPSPASTPRNRPVVRPLSAQHGQPRFRVPSDHGRAERPREPLPPAGRRACRRGPPGCCCCPA